MLKILNRKQAFIEINLTDKSLHISYIVVSNRKGSLIVTGKEKGIRSFSELHSILPKNIPAHYIFTGSGILFRILKNPDNLDTPMLIGSCFNSIDLNTVYYSTKNEGDNLFLSLIRKEKLIELLNELEKHNLFPTSIHFGQTNISLLGKYFEQNNFIIETGGLIFNFQNNQLNAITKVETKDPKYYEIGDEHIESDHIIVFCTALGYLSFNDDVQYSNDALSLNQDLRSDFLFKRLFKASWIIAVSIFFTTLLINFFLFNVLNDRNGELHAKINQFEVGREMKKQKAIQTKEEIETLSEFGFLNEFEYTRYVDELSNSLPEEMSFNELTINSLIDKKTNKRIFFNIGQISVDAKNQKKSGIDIYREAINNMAWVRSTNLKSVSRRGRDLSYYFVMEIDILH